MIDVVISNDFSISNDFYLFKMVIISTIIYLISFRNSVLNNRIALRSFLSLKVIILINKDLRDIKDLNIIAIKFM